MLQYSTGMYVWRCILDRRTRYRQCLTDVHPDGLLASVSPDLFCDPLFFIICASLWYYRSHLLLLPRAWTSTLCLDFLPDSKDADVRPWRSRFSQKGCNLNPLSSSPAVLDTQRKRPTTERTSNEAAVQGYSARDYSWTFHVPMKMYRFLAVLPPLLTSLYLFNRVLYSYI